MLLSASFPIRFMTQSYYGTDRSSPAFRPAQLPSARAKKSICTFCWPICLYNSSVRTSTSSDWLGPARRLPLHHPPKPFFIRSPGYGEHRCCELQDRLLTLQSLQCHFGFEGCAVGRSCRLVHCLSALSPVGEIRTRAKQSAQF